MIHDCNKIFTDYKRLINKTAYIWLAFMTFVSLIICFLCMTKVLPAYALYSLLWLIPTGVALLILLHIYNRKANLMIKNQLISMTASNARQTFEAYRRDFPDTYISDSRIKMCYLSKNGIDVEGALKRLNSNIDAYNRLALSFIKESDRLEDALYDLLTPKTLIQYAAKAHALRVRANELGLTKLTDTVFFHEIEAYGGCYGVVKANWVKLSLELDEAYEHLTKYIKSLGLEDSDSTLEKGITLKKWSAQLQEALSALDAYDTDKAKHIFNKLINCHLDADITKSLQEIVANIDDITTGAY